MKVARLGFMTTVLVTCLSCATPIPSHDDNYIKVMQEGEIKCLIEASVYRKGYKAPSLPDMSKLNNDYEVIDVLVDHIGILHKELRSLSNDGC